MMAGSLITLTTDFGEASPYVAALKGVLLSSNPTVRLLDLSHQLPPQDVRHAAFFLQAALPYFPSDTLHVVVVDPGVGTARALLYVEVGGQRLLVPDNGCWTLLPGPVARVIRLAESRYWRHPVSATFHGRDILAPVAGQLSQGLDPCQLGPAVTEWVRLEVPPPRWEAGQAVVTGEVVFVDHFGNLITNIGAALLAGWQGRTLAVRVGTHVVPQQVRTYGEAEPGQLVFLLSSTDLLEIAVVQGSAAARLGAGVGTPVRVESRNALEQPR